MNTCKTKCYNTPSCQFTNISLGSPSPRHPGALKVKSFLNVSVAEHQSHICTLRRSDVAFWTSVRQLLLLSFQLSSPLMKLEAVSLGSEINLSASHRDTFLHVIIVTLTRPLALSVKLRNVTQTRARRTAHRGTQESML